jgi:hypothetical protein
LLRQSLSPELRSLPETQQTHPPNQCQWLLQKNHLLIQRLRPQRPYQIQRLS